MRKSTVGRVWHALMTSALVLPLCTGVVTSDSHSVSTISLTAEAIKAGYAHRRDKVLDALLSDPGGNLWHSASKGLVALYRDDSTPLMALINLERAAGADPKCEECCGLPQADQCGYGAGYWSLPLLIRAYYMYQPNSTYEGGAYAGRLPAELSDRIEGYCRTYLSRGAGKGYGGCDSGSSVRCTSESTLMAYNSPPYAYISASDNHTVVQASAIFLAAQMLKDEGSGWLDLYQNWRSWWMRFLDVLVRRGFWETASPTYVERHLAPLYNLYDFAEDPLVKLKAEMVLDWYWAEIALELLHGVRGGAKMRVYWIAEGDRGAISARNDCMYPVYYLYFGDSAFEEEPAPPNAEMYSAIFATSTYRPPDVILELGANPDARGSYEITERRKGSCFVWDANNVGQRPYNSRRYSFVTPDYILGSFQSDADKQFMPYLGQTPHLQNSLVFATSPEARITWGEWGLIASGQINSFQYKNVLLASRAYHPELALAHDLPAEGILDVVEEQDGWLFIQEGQAYAALKHVNGEILIVEAARSADYGGDFDRFKQAMHRTQLGLSAANIDAGFIEYTTSDGDVLWFPLADTVGACRYTCACNPSEDRLPKVNGQRVDWPDYPLFGSPYVVSEWDSGLVEVAFNNRQLILDFRDPSAPRKLETRAPEPTAVPTITPVPTQTRTPTESSVPTRTSTRTASATLAPTRTGAPWLTPSSTATQVQRPTVTSTASPLPPAPPTRTPTQVPPFSPSLTQTSTPTASVTPSATPTGLTPTDTAVPPTLPAWTPTESARMPTGTATQRQEPTQTRTILSTASPALIRTSTATPSATGTPTQTASAATPTVFPSPAPTSTPPVAGGIRELGERVLGMLKAGLDKVLLVLRAVLPAGCGSTLGAAGVGE